MVPCGRYSCILTSLLEYRMQVGSLVQLPGAQRHPRRSGSRKATTLQAERSNPSRPSCFCGKKRSVLGGISTVLLDISERWIDHGFLGQEGAMTLASAPELRSLTTKSSSNSQGGLHQFSLFSIPRLASAGCPLPMWCRLATWRCRGAVACWRTSRSDRSCGGPTAC